MCPSVRVGTCPMDYSWAGKPYDVDQAHLLAECSNNGICNRKNV